MDTILIIVGLALAYALWPFFRGIVRGFTSSTAVDIRKEWNATPDPPPRTVTSPPTGPTKRAYVLKADQADTTATTTPTTRLFTYADERAAFAAHQPVWIRYEDANGNITERVVEIYHPQDDEYLFTWCRLKREPRTFSRHNIRRWQLLAETFQPDPLVAQYWAEEGTRAMGDKIPWHRWIEHRRPRS